MSGPSRDWETTALATRPDLATEIGEAETPFSCGWNSFARSERCTLIRATPPHRSHHREREVVPRQRRAALSAVLPEAISWDAPQGLANNPGHPRVLGLKASDAR